MNKDRIEGAATHVKGKVKEAIGHAIGDAKLEADGKAEKVAGTIQNAVGGAEDTIKAALKK